MLKYSNSVYLVWFKLVYFGWNGVLARGWLTPRWHGLKAKIASDWILITCNFTWCPEQDSNLHASQHSHLKRARLPFRHLGNRFMLFCFCDCKGKVSFWIVQIFCCLFSLQDVESSIFWLCALVFCYLAIEWLLCCSWKDAISHLLITLPPVRDALLLVEMLYCPWGVSFALDRCSFAMGWYSIRVRRMCRPAGGSW